MRRCGSTRRRKRSSVQQQMRDVKGVTDTAVRHRVKKRDLVWGCWMSRMRKSLRRLKRLKLSDARNPTRTKHS